MTDARRRSRKGPQRVLVVEDDAWIRTFLRDVLFDEGYCVIEAADGRTGLRLAAQHSPDLVLLDLAMPDFTGVDVLRTLRRSPRTRSLPVVILSAYSRVALSAYDASSVACVLAKPVDEATLLVTVRQCLNRVGQALSA
jgi:two-component system phosphate regulon response regulator PhoB